MVSREEFMDHAETYSLNNNFVNSNHHEYTPQSWSNEIGLHLKKEFHMDKVLLGTLSNSSVLLEPEYKRKGPRQYANKLLPAFHYDSK